MCVYVCVRARAYVYVCVCAQDALLCPSLSRDSTVITIYTTCFDTESSVICPHNICTVRVLCHL
jgi:hypothetical protein